MPISLYRGHLISWSEQDLEKHEGAAVPEFWTRKGLEKKIKGLEKEIKKLQDCGVIEVKPEVVVEGEWKVYLNPAARLQRGREQGHCLGDKVGGPGEEYIAVSNDKWDYGFTMWGGQPVADQTYGPGDCKNPNPKWEEAWQIANSYAGRAVFAAASEDEEHLQSLQNSLQHYRKLEFIRLRMDKKITPSVEFDRVRRLEEDTWSIYQVGEISDLLDIARRWRLKHEIGYSYPGQTLVCWAYWTGFGEPPEAPEGLEWIRR